MFLFTWLGRVFALMFNPPHLQFNWFSAVICKVRNGLYTWPIILRTHCVRSFCLCEMCVRWQSLIMKHINWQRLPPAEPGRAETTRNCCSPHKKAVCLVLLLPLIRTGNRQSAIEVLNNCRCCVLCAPSLSVCPEFVWLFNFMPK